MRFKTALVPFIFLLSFSIVFRTAPASGEPAGVLTLKESISVALKDNLSLKAAREKMAQSAFVKKQARAEFFPKLSTSYGYTRLSEQATFRSTLMPGMGIAVSSQDNYQWKGTLTQPLFTGFALLSSYRLAELGVDRSRMDLELKELDLALKVKEAYFNVLIADRGVEVARKEVEFLESSMNVASNFYKVGMIPVNDLLKVEVELANARQNLVKALNRAHLARSAFNTLLSRPIDAPVNLKDMLAYKPERGDYGKYLSRALQERPEVRLLEISILQADQEIRLARSKDYPEIAFTYDYIKEGDRADVSGSAFHDAGRWEATVGLTWTFWEWGKTHYSVKEKESLKKELIQIKAALEDSIKLEIKEALLNLETAEKNIPTTRKAVEQGEENLRVNEERYKAQVTTITEVLDAQALLTRARVNYYRALYDHNLARAKLERALGTY